MAGGRVVWRLRYRAAGRLESITFETEDDANHWRKAFDAVGPAAALQLLAEALGEPPDPQAPLLVTFGDVADGPDGHFERQATRVKRGKLTAYTLHRDRRAYALHLEEHFGHLPFDAVDVGDVGEWIDAQIDAGAAPKSIRNRHGLLAAILKHGQLRMKLRRDNPCEASELPTATTAKRQVRFFRPDEWALFRSCAAEDVRLLLDVDLAVGLRWGELAALRCDDVTFAGSGPDLTAHLHIQRAWSKRAPGDESPVRWDEGENASWVLGPPKNRRARWVVITGQVAHDLKAAIDGRGRHEYVWLTRRGNPWRYPDFHTDRWVPARDAAAELGLTKKITPHMLRHTAVVWSLAGGVPIEKVSEMIGHASIQITYDVYGGLLNLQDPAMAEAMAKAMLTSSQAIAPRGAPAAGPLRPGRRGEARPRKRSAG